VIFGVVVVGVVTVGVVSVGVVIAGTVTLVAFPPGGATVGVLTFGVVRAACTGEAPARSSGTDARICKAVRRVMRLFRTRPRAIPAILRPPDKSLPNRGDTPRRLRTSPPARHRAGVLACPLLPVAGAANCSGPPVHSRRLGREPIGTRYPSSRITERRRVARPCGAPPRRRHACSR
jgi:hypothetical protein